VPLIDRQKFDAIYDSYIIQDGFSETAEYYRIEKPRFRRSLELLCGLGILESANLLEIGGGQLAIVVNKLFGTSCSVADISDRYVAPLTKAGVGFFEYNLLENPPADRQARYDVVVLLEVIEHVPAPAAVVLERLKRFLKPKGVIFLTTPNLFRLRNLTRMILGVEFLDHFMIPRPGELPGHQLEYSADHLRWQIARANMTTVLLEHDEFGRTGHSFATRMARTLLAPLTLRRKWRDGLVAVIGQQ